VIDRSKPFWLRKEEIDARDVVREHLAKSGSGLEAKRTMSSAYCRMCIRAEGESNVS